jgi:hypothetical protein
MPRLTKLSVALLLAGAGLAQCAAHAAETAADRPLPARQAEIDAIVKEISPQRIQAYVNKLVGFGTRHTMSDTASDTRGIGAARRWIKSEMERCGAGRLEVRFDGHVHPVDNRINRPTEIVNVVATLPGSQPASKDRLYLVSGHYDSRVTDVMNATADAPGANDDASGTAAVIEMACVMARHKFDAMLVFMTVAAEEQGLYGSGDFARKARADKLNIAGMLNNDIIGSSHDEHGKLDNSHVRLFAEGVPPLKEAPSPELRTLLVTGGENDSITRQLARHVKETGERYVPNFKVDIIYRRDRYLRGGDHSPFLDAGYAAVRFTEPAEDFRHQHQDLRVDNGVKIGDYPEFVDPEYVAQVARVNAASLASLALAPAAPQEVKVKTAALDNGTDLVWKANAEPDLAGYRVVWRETTSPLWQGSRFVGNATTARIDMSKDNVLYGVQAVDKDGNVSPATYPLPAR